MPNSSVFDLVNISSGGSENEREVAIIPHVGVP